MRKEILGIKSMKLKFLEKILPPDNNVFYECFIDSAKNCKHMAILFNEAINSGITDEMLMKARMVKRQGSTLERDTITKLNSSFITPIEREDIQMLAVMLNKINKKIAHAFMNLNVYRVKEPTEEMREQAKTILTATNELIRNVSLLKKIHKTKEITASRDAMKSIETMGDEIMYRAIDKLFSGQFEAIEIIKLRDIYKDLESALDKCYTVADEILNIALKNN